MIPDPQHTDAPSSLSRLGKILGFFLKYRKAGIFAGLEDGGPDLKGEAIQQGSPEEFVSDLEALGPTFIKVGQALSTRPDMVAPEYLVALERIQDDVAPIPVQDVLAAIEAALGVKPATVFPTFDPVPLGSASLAQVHRATLRDGRSVAVKVQRPGIAAGIQADLDAMSSIADMADRWTDAGRRAHFADWVYEFRKSLLSEVDYKAEANNLVCFGEHLERYPELLVPQPLHNLTTSTVLTMELVDGTKATSIGGLRRTEQDLGKLASAVMRGYLDQVFIHGQVHADPHPGNLLVTQDDRIALLDLGMVAHVPPRRRERLLKVLFAAVDGRGEDVANEVIGMGTRLENFDEERYVREVGQRVARYAAAGGDGLSEGRLVFDLTLLGGTCGLRTPPELSLLGKTLLNLDAVCQALDPQMDVKRVIEEHLDHVMRERLKKAWSPTSIASEAMEVQGLIRESPRKIADILSLLAENKLQVRLSGLEESRLMENLQKIANRISAGIVTAALILASSMLMRVDGGPRLFGYPALAAVLFVGATALGFAIVVSALLRDRRAKPVETRGPR